ncbi:preprotein translocase subunit SecD [Naumannella cuiyingiana]|uniref:Preprotein translocase subunit SecD n=1 Tax=Naumannella cuiyingiana TaxID=1347891 RepID=A0A7Z0ILQ8_9ACTN|nr:hypothetical protein [Naumannella cuiyingiana]NYI71782.1 preprotein translocase subunit SecD [Naumannella cuiyingiana]
MRARPMVTLGVIALLALTGCAEVTNFVTGRQPAIIEFRPARPAPPGTACPEQSPVPAEPGAVVCADGQAYLLDAIAGTGRAERAEATPGATCSIRVDLDGPGTEALREVTGRLAGSEQLLALLAEGELLTAVRVAEPIGGGELQISGGQSESECDRLAERLHG